MTSPRPRRSPRALRRLLPVALLLALGGPLAVPAARADHAGDSPGPVNAGTTFGWWHQDGVRWMEHWEEGVLEQQKWRVRGHGTVQQQYGMLTLNTSRHGSLGATLLRKPRVNGRWEIRLRAHRFETSHADFEVATDLVPRSKKQQRCGAYDIGLERFRLGTDDVALYARNDTAAFGTTMSVDHDDQRWHTYAVELSDDHVSWFVDAHVVRTERRPEALSGVPLTVRFSMRAQPGATMNRSRMQMDWLRHFNLNGPNEQSIEAPRMEQGTYEPC